MSALVLGHRGGRGEGWPAENTLAAIERAHREGADGVEIDVRTCASGEVVVFHDPDLARATGGRDRRRICDLAWSELRRIELFGTRSTAPSLADVLDYCESRELWLNVELKYDVPSKLGLARAVARELRARRGKLVVSSFDPRLLVMTRVMGLRAPRAWLTDRKQKNVSALLRLVRRPIVSGAHLERSQATAARVEDMRARGLFVGVWTVNDPAEARSLSALGVRFLITDAPGAIRAALA